MSFVKGLISNINEYKAKNADRLIDQQVAYIPRVEDGQIECSTPSYLLDGIRNIINPKIQVCLKLKYLRFKPMHPRKTIKYKSHMWDLKELIANNVLYPFMLFINGMFIPWDRIKVVLGLENYYLLINIEGEPYEGLNTALVYSQIISLPANVTYYDENPTVDEYTIFSFNNLGLIDYESPVQVFKTNKYSHVAFSIYITTEGVNAFQVINTSKVKLSEENVVLFTNGYMSTGKREKLKLASDRNASAKDDGHEGPYLDLRVIDGTLSINPIISFDSNLLTIGNGTNEYADVYTFIVFVNTEYTQTADNISLTSSDYIAPIIQADNAGEVVPEYFDDLQTQFEMKMNRSKKYSENVADAIKTMLTYNASFFNKTFLANSNMEVIEMTGAEFNALIGEDGTVTYLRSCIDYSDEYFILLVNGELYKYYHLISHKYNKCIIPVQGINDTDTVELLKFKNVNNSVYDMAITTSAGFEYRYEKIINNDMVLFSTLANHEKAYSYPLGGLQHFPVDYTLEYDESGKVKINLDDSFYYNKHLKVAYKNRFCHFRKVLEGTTSEYSVDLGTTFMYCNDYKKFMVFYNGRRLDEDHYRLILPVRPSTPFYEFRIYLTTPISDGDQLDVFYLPCLADDITILPEFTEAGGMIVDKTALGYTLSTDLYMVWVNGKKIPRSHIVDINATKMRIICDEESTTSVSITKYIPDISDISDVFKENEALWDSITSQIAEEDIYSLLGISGEELTNTEIDVYANAVPVKSIMYELIREQYMMNPNVDTTKPFVYDYQDVDTSAIESIDEEGNVILPTADANNQENLNNVNRPWS